MDLRKLGHVLALAKAENFARAAESVHLSQPAFSRRGQDSLSQRDNAEMSCQIQRRVERDLCDVLSFQLCAKSVFRPEDNYVRLGRHARGDQQVIALQAPQLGRITAEAQTVRDLRKQHRRKLERTEGVCKQFLAGDLFPENRMSAPTIELDRELLHQGD